ncbi:hypothetical protein SAMN02982917_0571 [Azospirillum oryzae]|uniref:B30.2/SPRY domain-containing protein n=1 Tax=Azospirillum oryzae TaxID=286727 RepID=A0A1X7HTT4_9PROT|nr:hypothetical protein [Azospirillum oryzae]SMF92351.1 hypothetical protein SAMN02982917_0571 [Azospirillum oryzae]
MATFNGRNWTVADMVPFKYVENWDTFFDDVIAEMDARRNDLGASIVATSSTSDVSIGTGTKTLTVASPSTKGFSASMYVVAVDGANSANAITGRVTSYNTTTGALVIAVPTGGTTGSGTPSSWVIGISGAVGPQGPTGLMPLWGGTAGGTANALTATTGTSLSSLTTGQIVGVKVGASANSGASTLAVDSTGAIAIRKDGSALVGGELAAGADRYFMYDGTYWRLLSGAGGLGWLSTTVAKTADFTVTTTYNANLIRCTTALTATMDTIASLPAGFACRIWGDGVSVVISGGASTINGAATITIAAGEFADIAKDQAGTNYVATKGGASTVGFAFDPTKKGSGIVLSSNNTVATLSTATVGSVIGAKGIAGTDKKVFAFRLTALGTGVTVACGFGANGVPYDGAAYVNSPNGYSYTSQGNKGNNGGGTTFGASYTVGDEIEVALDIAAGKAWFGKNGTWQGSGNPATGANPAFTFTAGTTMFPAVYLDGASGGASWTIVTTPAVVPTGFAIL